jgi:hypothetical protein
LITVAKLTTLYEELGRRIVELKVMIPAGGSSNEVEARKKRVRSAAEAIVEEMKHGSKNFAGPVFGWNETLA